MPKNVVGPSESQFIIGIAYVSSYLKKEGYNIFTINLNFCNDTRKALNDKIIECGIDVIMVGGLSGQYHMVKEILNIVDDIDKKVIKVVGGGLVTSQPKIAMRALQTADIGVIGEGEITSAFLCDALNNNLDLSIVDGIIYKKDGGYILNNERGDIVDLDSLPFPDYEGFDFAKHINTDVKIENDFTSQLRNVYIIGSRSCPYNCTFCFHSSGERYRTRSLDNIFEEIDYLYNNYKIKCIAIQDELFSAQKERLLEFCKRIKKYNLHWFSQFRVDLVDDEVLDVMKDSGCTLLGVGIESADNRILKSMKKNITVEQIENALKKMHRKNISFAGNLIFGDKEETKETAEATLNWWKEHSHYNITMALIVPFPGTALYQYAIDKGIIKDPVKYLQDGCPNVNVSKMTDEEFGAINTKILQYPLAMAPKYTDYTYSNKKLVAKCEKCNTANEHDFNFFETMFVICKNCGQKHFVPVNDNITKMITSKVELLMKEGKVAVWGINPPLYHFLAKTEIVNNDRMYFIDISKVRQMSKIHGKKICSPDIIQSKDIKYVMTGIPGIFSTIERQVKNNYQDVEKVLTMSKLID
ncbi:B12-binding domain-containing radical SAM protein [Selenihalanaerobacter shriftii]|nr:radical SAM protein [Selenihalanaerobacter shriftii]